MNTKKIKLRLYDDSLTDEVPTERMTVRRADGRWALANNDNAHPFKQFDKLPKALTRLAYFENLEEEGRLLILPCKIGETVYRIQEKTVCANGFRYLHNSGCSAPFACYDCPRGVDESTIVEDVFELIDLKRFGKSIFLTHEEAEQALQIRKRSVLNDLHNLFR